MSDELLEKANYCTSLKNSEQFRKFFLEPMKAQKDAYDIALRALGTEERDIRFAQGALNAIDYFFKLVSEPGKKLTSKEKKNERRDTNARNNDGPKYGYNDKL